MGQKLQVRPELNLGSREEGPECCPVCRGPARCLIHWMGWRDGDVVIYKDGSVGQYREPFYFVKGGWVYRRI